MLPIIVTIVIFIIILALINGVYQKKTNAMCQSTKRLDGKTVVVTGGTSGIGLEIALDLAGRGARVIIACPFDDEGASAKEQIVQQTGNHNVSFKHLDLGSLESTRKFAADIMATEERLDILINNAGVGVPGDFITKDGMHFIMQVNYFGAFLLTILLLPLLKKSGTSLEPSRIINMSSLTHRLISSIDFKNLNSLVNNRWCTSLCLLFVYARSKLCLALFSHELTKRLKQANLVVNTVDPGFVGTKIYESIYTIVGRLLIFIFNSSFKTPREGAQTALHATLDRKAGEVSGQYFINCELSKATTLAYDDNTAKKLWEESVKWVRLSDSELNSCVNG